MDLRQLFKWTGGCAFIMALIVLVYYVVFLAANGFMGMSTAPLTAEQLIKFAQARGNQINALLDPLSYFVWIPALVGMFALLRKRTPGRAFVGGAFAAFAVVGYFAASVMGSLVMGQAQGTVTDSLKERLEVLSAVSNSFMMMGMYAAALSNLLWGLAFRSQAGLGRMVGYLLLVEVALFVIMSGFYMARLDFLFNVGFLLANLAFAAVFVLAGALLWQSAKEKAQG